MKKTMRTIIALLLAAVMTFGMSSAAFAADDSTKRVKWTNLFGDDYNFYFADYALVEGENSVSFTDSGVDIMEFEEDELGEINAVCYEFEAEQSGYYLISSGLDTVLSVAESYNGTTADGSLDYVDFGDGVSTEVVYPDENFVYPYNDVYYIEKGTNLVGFAFAFNSYIVLDAVKIEYLGSEIKEYSFAEESLDDYIIGYNVWDDDSGEIAMATDCEVTFVPENKLLMNNVVLMGTCNSTPKEGKNQAKVELFGIEKDVEFTAYKLESLVKSVEITDLENHTVFTNDYKGDKHYNDASGETITVKFSDGTEYSEVLNESAAEIVLPNGVVMPAYAGLTLNDDGTYDFVISVADKIFARYDVTEKDDSFFGNISTLTNDNFGAIKSSADNFFVGMKFIGNDSEFAKECFGMISDDLAQIFTNFISFIKYYIG